MSHSVVKKSFTIVLGRISFENFLLRSRGFNDPKKRKKSEIETFVLVIPVLFGMLWKTQTAARDILHSQLHYFFHRDGGWNASDVAMGLRQLR